MAWRTTWRTFWRLRRRRIVQGALLGLLIHGILLYYPSRLSRWIEDSALDWMMYTADFAKRLGRDRLRDNIQHRFTFINVDDGTLEAWATPYVPRDKLQKLIEFAVRNEASVVVVDVDLRHKIGGEKGELSIADRELGEYLQGIAKSVRSTASAKVLPLIVLAQPLSTRSPQTSSECQQRPPSFLDDFVGAAPSGPVQWGSVRYHQDTDQVIRYWRLWETTCDLRLIPSVQWRVARYLQENASSEGAKTERKYTTEPPRELVEKPDLTERITYGIPWKGLGGPKVKQIFIAFTKTTHVMSESPGKIVPASTGKEDGYGRAMSVVPALAIDQKLASNDFVKGNIVVIGGSAELSRDVYMTPIGEMPGAVILINSIDSLVRHRQLHHIPTGVEFAIAAVLIVAVSVCFASFHHTWAYVTSGLVTLFILLPLSFFGFHRGYWINFALPLLAVQLHHLIAQIEESMPGGHRGKR